MFIIVLTVSPTLIFALFFTTSWCLFLPDEGEHSIIETLQ